MKILLEQDKSTEGLKEALAALESGSEYIPDVLAMSDEFYLPEAQVIYRKVISMGNKEVLPYLGLGNIALHSGDLAEAEKWFIQARDLQAEHPAVLLAWGRLAAAKAARLKDDGQAKKELQEARALLEKSKSKGEDSATIHTELGGVITGSPCGRRPPRNMPKPCACGGGATICAFRSASPMPSWEKSKMPNRNIARYSRSALTMRMR